MDDIDLTEIDKIEQLWEFAKTNINIGENPNNIEWNWNTIDNKVKRLFTYPYHDQRSIEWDNIRKYDAIATASTISAITVKKNPWTSPQTLFDQKTNRTGPGVLYQPMMIGMFLEDFVADLYAKETNQVLFKFGIIMDVEKYPYVGVSPDRVTMTGKNVEIKVTSKKLRLVKDDLEWIKKQQYYYWHQIQLQAHILGVETTDLVRYNYKDKIMQIVEIPTDYDWWDTHKKSIDEFIQDVLYYRAKNPNWDKKIWPQTSTNANVLKCAWENKNQFLSQFNITQ